MANSKAVQRLRRELEEFRTVKAGVLSFIRSMPDMIREAAAKQAAGDEEAIEQLATELDTEANELAAAITNNTPAATEPAPGGTAGGGAAAGGGATAGGGIGGTAGGNAGGGANAGGGTDAPATDDPAPVGAGSPLRV